MFRFVLPLCLVLPLSPGAQQLSPRDHERARIAVERGEIRPLSEILQTVRASHPGEVLEVELEEEDGVLVYEVEILTPAGLMLEIDLEARSGTILSVEEDD
ncbi:MAG TPA: PepSY domain-containing protein [Paracoccus sp. (in: a-proteobacteria)]|nr:PepSY domain-containing protein [Paracoccus sp. (in: a-proteobacteria)]